MTLWGLQPYFTTLQYWLGQSETEAASVAGFLYTTLLAVGLGMLCSTARWLLIDRLFRRPTDGPASWDFKRLSEVLPAFDRLIEDHFRYYQFHGNNLVAVNVAIILVWLSGEFQWLQVPLMLIVDFLLYAGAADTIRKYDARVSAILSKKSAFTSREEFPNLDL